VLACTHFPLVKAELMAASPRRFNWVDSGDGIARRVVHWTKDKSWESPNGRVIFTAYDEKCELLRPALRRYGLTDIDYL
jgi:glutamate racemase